MLRELRASHVGETVAVRLYDGAIAASTDPGVVRFATTHRQVEAGHLRLFNATLPRAARSRPLTLWRMAGWLMGWIPARISAAAFYAVVARVEHWVDGHYARQIALARRLCPDPALIRLLDACRADEARHSLEAAGQVPAMPLHARILGAVAVTLSRLGVQVARWL